MSKFIPVSILTFFVVASVGVCIQVDRKITESNNRYEQLRQEAYRQGRECGAAGQPPTANPWSNRSDTASVYRAWANGWIEGDRERLTAKEQKR